MALSGLDIYKLLPKTNCKECGFPTCLAFAMQLAKKAVSIDKCPSVSPATKAALDAASQPPIRLVQAGSGEALMAMGNETVLFRHEEKFRNPCGIGCIIDDNLSDSEISARVGRINALHFERIGQALAVNAIAVRQTGTASRFAGVVRLVAGQSPLVVVLMSSDPQALEAALELLKGRKPVVYALGPETLTKSLDVIKRFMPVVVVTGDSLDAQAALTAELSAAGINDIMLSTVASGGRMLWDLTQARRLALKKSVRALGFPMAAVIDQADAHQEMLAAASAVLKYAGLVLVRSSDPDPLYALLTLRQNIYSDPQKPLQIEPKLYEIGSVTERSPVLVTTNFSLSYYTVLGEVEASKVPAYILSVDTEGMSVLTAWAAEKFTPGKISETLKKLSVRDRAARSDLVIPGYVAMMSGDLEDQADWKIVVGPKEASGIPAFLKSAGYGKV